MQEQLPRAVAEARSPTTAGIMDIVGLHASAQPTKGFYITRSDVAWVELAKPGFRKLHPGYLVLRRAFKTPSLSERDDIIGCRGISPPIYKETRQRRLHSVVYVLK